MYLKFKIGLEERSGLSVC